MAAPKTAMRERTETWPTNVAIASKTSTHIRKDAAWKLEKELKNVVSEGRKSLLLDVYLIT